MSTGYDQPEKLTHLELHVQVVGTEQVDHPRNPSLLLCYFFSLVLVWSSPWVFATQ